FAFNARDRGLFLFSIAYGITAIEAKVRTCFELSQADVSVWFKLRNPIATGNSFCSGFVGHHILLVQGG
ncbi:MAG: hypothetical protein WA869_02780, partial [Alloacidobacterium sp.]